MKKILSLILVLLLFSALLVSCGKSKSAKTTNENSKKYITSEGYEYRIINNKVQILGYKGSEVNLVIPSKIDGKKLNSINGFNENNKIKSVVIPDGIEYLSYSFVWCDKLESVKLPQSLKRLDKLSLTNCKLLKSITLPKNFEKFNLADFNDEESIAYPFEGCSLLDKIEVEKGNKYFESYNGLLYSKDDKILLKCPEGKSGEIILPDFARDIDYYDDLSVSAFSNCSKITSVTFPEKFGETLTYLEGDIFSGCESLTSINFHKNNKYFTSVDGVWFSKDMKRIYRYPQGRKGSYSMPNLVENANLSHTFNECKNLTSLVIGDNFNDDLFDLENLAVYKNLKEVTVSPNNKNYYFKKGNIYYKDGFEGVLVFAKNGKYY